MRTEISVGVLDFFVFLTVFQAIYISFFIIRNGRTYSKANIYQGLFLLSFALLAFEEFLNNTGYITKVLWLTSFSQPLNFFLGPFFYLYISYSLNPDKKRKNWVHFIFPVFWLFYIGFYLAQPNEVKYNSYISLKHPDWEQVKAITKFSEDILGIRQYCNQLSIISLIAYNVASLIEILRKLKKLNLSFFSVKIPVIVSVRNSFLHFFLVALVYSVLKVIWGMNSDVGMIVVCY